MDNRAIAQMLYETADLMEVAGEDSFRIRSYRNAAGVIESHPEQISSILKDPERKVTEIPGIGKGIAGVLAEIEQRGSFERRDEMLEKYPAGALELLKIQGLGPKSIRLLFETYRCATIDDLEGDGVEKITPAGSLRRGRETVGDLDLLVTGPGALGALEKFVKHPKAQEVLGRGVNKASI